MTLTTMNLFFVGSNSEELKFNTFGTLLSFLLDICNGKITLKRQNLRKEIQKKKIENLRGYRINAEEGEKEIIDGLLMQANDLFEYRDKVFDAFKGGTFLSEHLKESDAAACDYVLKDVNNFIQKIKLMEDKINLSLFEDSVGSPSPADYAKKLINIRNANEDKGIVAEIEDRISNLKDRIKEMNETEKKYKNVSETLEIIKKIIDYNKDAQKIFQHASKVDKGKSKPKPKDSIAERVKLRRQKLDIIKKKKESINNGLFSHYFDYLNPVIMFEKLRDAIDKKKIWWNQSTRN